MRFVQALPTLFIIVDTEEKHGIADTKDSFRHDRISELTILI